MRVSSVRDAQKALITRIANRRVLCSNTDPKEDNQIYKDMTADILHQLLSTFDQPEHLPVLAEMSSNMIAICARKCFETRKPKGPCKKTTPKFSKELNDAYQEHKSTCNEWRKAGRPSSADHPAKHAKLISQRKIQRISRDEMANHA